MKTKFTALFNTPVNPETDLLPTVGTFDTGFAPLNYVAAMAGSVYNVGATGVNGLMNGLSLPMQGYAAATDQTLAQAENQLMATAASTGPAAPFLMTGAKAVSAPAQLSRGVRNLSKAVDVIPKKTNKDYGVAFFGEDNVKYYTPENATIGREGKTFFFMPLEDSAKVKNSSDAALYTGRAPSAEKAYLEDGDIYGLSFPLDGKKITKPTAEDAGGWPHYLEGGNTAVKTGDGPNAGYLVNPTREFVIPGGDPVPEGSVLFKLGSDGEWSPIREY